MNEPSRVQPMLPRMNLWVEQAGQVVLSQWRVQLLQAIEESGSLSAAAVRMDVPYHTAWNKLQEMERGLGEQLVVRRRGGLRGGGTSLTPAGCDYVQRFVRLAGAMNDVLAREFAEAFDEA